METFRDSVRWDVWVRRLHLLSTIIAVLLGIVAGLRAIQEARRRWLVALFFGLVVILLAAAVLAYMIPWDQLALWSFSESVRLPGTPSVFDDTTFILLDASRWSPSTLQTMRTVHQLVLPAIATMIVVVLGAVASRRTNAESAGNGDADIVE